MAGSATVTRHGSGVKVHTVAWTSDASGNCDAGVVHIDGQLQRVVTDPSGTAAPTDDYDITLVDEDGYDIAGGQLANRDTANTETVVLTAALLHYGNVTVTVANAGNAKSGTIKLYVR